MVPVPLVRYRFGASANVDLHFHEIDGRSFFFYPSGLQYRDGQWVFAEFGVHGASVSCMLRGRVYGQQSPRFTGSWFEFPVRGFPKVLRQLEATYSPSSFLSRKVTSARAVSAEGKRRLSAWTSSLGLPFRVLKYSA